MEPRHLPIRPQCGACGGVVKRHERVVVLVGNAGGTAFGGIMTRPFPFPQQWTDTEVVDGWEMCRRAHCHGCQRECVVVHRECLCMYLAMFEAQSQAQSQQGLQVNTQRRWAEELVDDFDPLWAEALDRLWTAGTWQQPWPFSTAARLEDDGLLGNPIGLHYEATALVVGLSGVPWLTRLPVELMDLVREGSTDAHFWRAVSVQCLVKQTTTASRQTLSRMPLSNVVSFKRGELPVMGRHLPRMPLLPLLLPPSPLLAVSPFAVIRLTIDHRGIRQIERLRSRPAYDGSSTSTLAFIVQDADDMADVEVECKDGLLRLRLPPGRSRYPAWNTACPPDPVACQMMGTDGFRRASSSWARSRYTRFSAVSLQNCYGLTFFCLNGAVMGIHVHRSADDDPTKTFERLSIRQKWRVAWVFLPISRTDPVVSLRTRGTDVGFVILVQKKISGQAIIGELGQPMPLHISWGAGDEMALVWGEHDDSRSISLMGAYCRRPSESISSKTNSSLPREFSDPIVFNWPAYFSWAPLWDVQCVSIFQDPKTRCCQGILFEYENGGSRAVGQCHRRRDRVRTTVKPSCICLFPVYTLGVADRNMVVKATRRPAHKHRKPGWLCSGASHNYLMFTFRNSSFGVCTNIWTSPGD